MILNDFGTVLSRVDMIMLNLLVVTAFTLNSLCRCGKYDGICLKNGGFKVIRHFSSYPMPENPRIHPFILKVNQTYPYVVDYHFTSMTNFTEGSFHAEFLENKAHSWRQYVPFPDFKPINICKYFLLEGQCPLKVSDRGILRVELKLTRQHEPLEDVDNPVVVRLTSRIEVEKWSFAILMSSVT